MKHAAVVLSLALGSVAFLGACVGSSQRATQPERAAELNLNLAIDYMRRGNLAQAKEKLDRSLQQNSRNASAQSFAGMLYDRLGEPNKADSHYERAVSLAPDDPEILNNYAVYLCQKTRYERGEKFALKAAGNPLYRTPEVGYLNAGNCALNAGDAAGAEEHFRRALKASPRFGQALLQMADLEFRQANYVSARAFLTRYQEVGRTDPKTLWLGVRIERGLGNDAQAQHYAQRLKSEYPNAVQTKELVESERNPG